VCILHLNKVTAINFNSTLNSMIDAEFEFFEVSLLDIVRILKNFDNLGKMRSNYLNFLELVLSLIESKVEFDVYCSFLLSSNS
jgi:hypothetical protein